MTEDNKRTFLRIVKKVPEDAMRAYELTRLLKDYEKMREQQTRELGEAGQAQLEQKIVKESVQELFDRVRRGEQPWTT